MSNHLAIATVTATLGHLIIKALASSGVDVTKVEYGRPTSDGLGSGAKVHIHLYQVTPDTARRNDDMPTRDSEGRLVNRPRIALNLHYLVVFYGDAKTFEPERMLGAVVRSLHARPLLSSQMIREVVSDNDNPVLTASNLADAPERVRFTPAVVSMDELSKLWSVFFQTPHALSLAYDASVVFIDAEESGPSAAPVLSRGADDQGAVAAPDAVPPFPLLESVYIGSLDDALLSPLPRSYPAAVIGNLLILRGVNLGGDTVSLRFKHMRFSEEGHPHFLAPHVVGDAAITKRTETEIQVVLDTDAVGRIGTYGLAVVVTKNGKTHSTNDVPFLLAPRIDSITPTSPIAGAGQDLALSVTCTPAVLASQQVSLLLADREAGAKSRDTDTQPLDFIITNAPAVTDAIVRIRVDGVDSIPYERAGNPPRLQFAANQKVTIT